MKFCSVAILMVLLISCAAAAPATTQSTDLSNSSSVDEILDVMQARGQNLSDFSATVKLTDTDNSTGDSSANDGKVLFQRKPDGDARIRVAFDKSERGDKIFDVDHQYTLDDGWLVERDYQAKKEIRRQVLRPGEKLDPLKLGEGPFPLPIGQKKEDVEKIFDVSKVDPAKDDPQGAVHLLLTPKTGTNYAKDFKSIDIWVRSSDGMPVRIQTLDLNETTIKVTDLSDVKINVGLSDSDFSQPTLPATGWDQITEPYGDQ
jgi:outer membrane lipoprotein-sorting protein